MLTFTTILEFEKILIKSKPQDWKIENREDEDKGYVETLLSYKDKIRISYYDKDYTWFRKNFINKNETLFIITFDGEDFYANINPDNEFLDYTYEKYSDSNERIWEFTLNSENYKMIFTIHLAKLINEILFPKLKEYVNGEENEDI